MGKWMVLNSIDVAYFQCPTCLFVQTEEPFWLASAYQGAIARADVGVMARNLRFAEVANAMIVTWYDPARRFLDYGGGYGIFVRLMRDRGFDFYWQDKYAEGALLCKGFEASPDDSEFELVTAFEVVEHFPDPLGGFDDMISRGKGLLFSTELLPSENPKPNEWWYYALDFGQHVSLYSHKALSHIAHRFGLFLTSNGSSLHMLSRERLNPSLFRMLTRRRFARLVNRFRKRVPLIEADFAAALKATTNVSAAKAFDGQSI